MPSAIPPQKVQQLLDRAPTQNAISWNIIIVRQGQERIKEAGIKVPRLTGVSSILPWTTNGWHLLTIGHTRHELWEQGPIKAKVSIDKSMHVEMGGVEFHLRSC